MGWTVYVNLATVAGQVLPATTSWPAGTQQTWAAASAVGLFANQSGGAVTVGTYADEMALLEDTASSPTITRYINKVKFVSDTAMFVATPDFGSDYYLLQENATYPAVSTPKVSYGIRFAFSTSGAVDYTAASAWYGVDDGGGVVEASSTEAGFICRIKELASSQSWALDATAGAKMSMNINAGQRQSGNYQASADVHWFLAISLKPKSAGEKTHGAIAMDITYS